MGLIATLFAFLEICIFSQEGLDFVLHLTLNTDIGLLKLNTVTEKQRPQPGQEQKGAKQAARKYATARCSRPYVAVPVHVAGVFV